MSLHWRCILEGLFAGGLVVCASYVVYEYRDLRRRRREWARRRWSGTEL